MMVKFLSLIHMPMIAPLDLVVLLYPKVPASLFRILRSGQGLEPCQS